LKQASQSSICALIYYSATCHIITALIPFIKINQPNIWLFDFFFVPLWLNYKHIIFMAKPLYIEVSEDTKTLKQLLKRAKTWEHPRLLMLLEMKKADTKGITKEELMRLAGVCGQSINNWRKAYREGGLSQLLSHKKKGFKPSVFSAEEKTMLGDLVNNPKNGIVGYVELQKWVKENFDKDVKYITLVKFMEHNFKTKIKVARKSHIKKDLQAVEALKKTSDQSALRQ